VENYRISSKIRAPKIEEDSEGQGKDNKILRRRYKFPSQTQDGKGNGKVHPITGHKGLKVEYRYRFTLSLTSTLDGGGWSTPRSGRFTPGKAPVHIV